MRNYILCLVLTLASTESFIPLQQRNVFRSTVLKSTALSGDLVARLQNDYRGLMQAVEYQANYFKDLKNNPEDMTEEKLEKAAYEMTLKRFQQEQEAEMASADFSNILHELDEAKADLDRYRDSSIYPDVRAFYEMEEQDEMEVEEKLDKAQRLLQLIQQSERDLKLALDELHAAHDQEDIEEWRRAEMRKHEVLVKSLKSHLIDHDPFRGDVAF